MLVVDDEPTIRSAARQALERHGFVVWEASDGVDEVREHVSDIDAMVLDTTLSRLSGGPSAFLQKPFRAAELAGEVASLLGATPSSTKPWSQA